jgi:hypothetical protein
MANPHIYGLTDTWNSGATTFNAISMDVTDTASAAASRLLTLKVATAEKFAVTKEGSIVASINGNAIFLSCTAETNTIQLYAHPSRGFGLGLNGSGTFWPVHIPSNSAEAVALKGSHLLGWYDSDVSQPVNVAFSRIGNAKLRLTPGDTTGYATLELKQLNLDATITAGGTTGAQTIDKAAGTVNFAAAATSVVVTNALVSTSSLVWAFVRTADTTAAIKNVVPGTGSFTITLSAAATAETSVGFVVIN